MRMHFSCLLLSSIILLSAKKHEPMVDAPPMTALSKYGYDKSPYKLDPGPHLFIDWRYIDAGRVTWETPDSKPASLFGEGSIENIRPRPQELPSGIRLEAQKAEKIGPIIKNDVPWEGIYSCSTLEKTDTGYRMWYEVMPSKKDVNYYSYFICMAESTDSLTWTRPNLGLVEFEGNKNNNIVFGGPLTPDGLNGFSIFRDPTASPDERYKMIYVSMAKKDEMQAFAAKNPDRVGQTSLYGSVMRGAVSADGVHWQPIPEILVGHQSDTQTTVYYDEVLGRYVGYFRVFVMGRRAIAWAETTDFRRWPIPELVLWPRAEDAPSDDYYLNSKTLYPGTRTMHLMFPAVYRRRIDSESLAMASSLDGINWQWVPGGFVLEPGPDGQWDAGLVPGGFGMVEIPGDRVALPFTGYQLPHKFPRWVPVGAIGLATWKKERLCALTADQQGEFSLVSLLSTGRSLYLNHKIHRSGSIQVEVEGDSVRTFENCDPLTGDQLKAPVSWKGDSTLGIDPGKEVKLRFRLNSASLYSFEIK